MRNVRLEIGTYMLTYNFTDIGSDSIYEFLYKCIKNDILSGKIKPGEKLPSKRTFAKNLNVSVITIEGAYEMLMAEGYIYSVPKKGFYVENVKYEPKKKEAVSHKRIVLSKNADDYIADFTSNQTDINIFPFSVWTRSMRDVMAKKQSELMVNPPCGGIMELRENIAKYLFDFRGMSVRPEQIIIGAGTEYLYGLIIQILGRRLKYGVENPGYHKAARIYEQWDVKYDYINMDREGVVIGQLVDKEIDVIHTSPSHHFPTGTVMPIGRRYELLGWASNEKHRYIIEDDYDSELRLAGKPIPTLQSIDVSDKVIYINTFTKTLCSTVRISYMVLPEALAEKFYEELSFYSGTVSNFEQYTLACFMGNGSFEKHINRLRKFYQEKRDLLLNTIANHPLKKYVTIQEEEAGVHFLMRLDTVKSEADVIRDAKEKGIKLNPLSNYYFGDSAEPENVYVINYSSLAEENIGEIVERLYEVVR